MTELKPGTVEASHEKHIPVITVEGNTVTVTVGAVEHPMVEDRSILCEKPLAKTKKATRVGCLFYFNLTLCQTVGRLRRQDRAGYSRAH